MTPAERFERNKKLAFAIVNRWARRFGKERADYEAAALRGLWEACLKYDPAREATWSGFAGNAVRWATFEATGRRLGLSPERVRQIQEAGFRKIRENYRGDPAELFEPDRQPVPHAGPAVDPIEPVFENVARAYEDALEGVE